MKELRMIQDSMIFMRFDGKPNFLKMGVSHPSVAWDARYRGALSSLAALLRDSAGSGISKPP